MNATATVLEFKPKRTAHLVRKYRGTDRPSLSAAQLNSCLSCASVIGARELAMVILMVSHGLRVSELTAMKVSDVDLSTGKVLVNRLKGSASGYQAMCENLFGWNERKVLADWLTARQWVTGTDSDVLFPSRRTKEDGNRELDRSQISRLFVQICEAAHIAPEFQHVHILRHTTGQLLFDRGMRLEELQLKLGHRSISSTSVYARPSAASVDLACAAAFSS